MFCYVYLPLRYLSKGKLATTAPPCRFADNTKL